MNAVSTRRIAWPRLLRQIHLWLGVFFAPSILFFAFTGGVQELKLHEAHGDYTPPPILEKLGQVHIHQKFAVKPQRRPEGSRGEGPAAAGAPKPAARSVGPPPPSASVVASRWFFTATAVGLGITTLLGLWIGVVQARKRTLPLLALAAGCVLPVVLLML